MCIIYALYMYNHGNYILCILMSVMLIYVIEPKRKKKKKTRGKGKNRAFT